MKQNSNNLTAYEQAPLWVERSLPRCTILGNSPSVLLIKFPDEQHWVVASRVVVDVIANPGSFLGGLMRSHCALLGLRHLSNN